MKKLQPTLAILVGFVILHVWTGVADAGGGVVVPEILSVRYSIEKTNPANLVVTAKGQVPTGGNWNPQLVRVIYVTPPADGIQAYFLMVTPPQDPVPQVITKVEGENRWEGYTEAAPWIKGIRVYGVGNGIRVVRFKKSKTPPADEPAGPGKRPQFESTYQHAPVHFGFGSHGFRGIGIVGRIANGGTIDLSLNPNVCSLDEFGDRTLCTEIASTHVKVELQRIRRSDPKGLGRSLYRMKSNEFPKSLAVYLVQSPSDSGYRIVLKRPNSSVVVALEKSLMITKAK